MLWTPEATLSVRIYGSINPTFKYTQTIRLKGQMQLKKHKKPTFYHLPCIGIVCKIQKVWSQGELVLLATSYHKKILQPNNQCSPPSEYKRMTQIKKSLHINNLNEESNGNNSCRHWFGSALDIGSLMCCCMALPFLTYWFLLVCDRCLAESHMCK